MISRKDLFKRLTNAVFDLQSADVKNYERPLGTISHLLQDESLREISDALKSNVNLEEFLESSKNKTGMGGPILQWPTDPNQALGLSLAIVEKLGKDPRFALNFSHEYFGNGPKVITGLRSMTSNLIIPFVRDFQEHVKIMDADQSLGAEERPMLRRVFVSHGRSKDWLEVQAHIEKDMNLHSMELAQEANQGRTVIEKLEAGANSCDSAVIIMSGDDLDSLGNPRVRENVMHEIGFFHGRYGRDRIVLLHEEGVSVPTNLAGIVYIPYPKGMIHATFGVLDRELRHMYQ